MKLQSKPRLLMMIRIMLLTVYIYALNRKARPSRAGIYFRLSSCFHREIMYRSVIPKARRPSGRKRLILEKLFQGCRLFVLLSFGAYDSQLYEVITRPSMYEMYFCFMQNALATWQLVWSVYDCIYLFSFQCYDSWRSLSSSSE